MSWALLCRLSGVEDFLLSAPLILSLKLFRAAKMKRLALLQIRRAKLDWFVLMLKMHCFASLNKLILICIVAISFLLQGCVVSTYDALQDNEKIFPLKLGKYFISDAFAPREIELTLNAKKDYVWTSNKEKPTSFQILKLDGDNDTYLYKIDMGAADNELKVFAYDIAKIDNVSGVLTIYNLKMKDFSLFPPEAKRFIIAKPLKCNDEQICLNDDRDTLKLLRIMSTTDLSKFSHQSITPAIPTIDGRQAEESVGKEKGANQKRVALVIGNSAYAHADPLKNTLNDSRKIRDVLSRLGFDVVYGEDQNQRGMNRLIGKFASSLDHANVALVYYAGHGATFDEIPYAVPVDAELSNIEEEKYELIPIEALVGELRRASGIRIAILDACRDDAAERGLKRLASRGFSSSRGLARIKDPDGIIIAYATQSMTTASDGEASNSPFTSAILKYISVPGLDIKDMLFKAANDVISETRGKQRPEISISLYDPYSLAGP